MSLKRLSLQDFVIVRALEVEFDAGFGVLTGETGAGKSILLDALQLALGGRGEAGWVREGAARCEIAAEFELGATLLASLGAWLEEAGFACEGTLLLKRVIDAQGKSRMWINGSNATVAQARELGTRLVHIHGQHEWHQLTQTDAARRLLDAYGGVDTSEVRATWGLWQQAAKAVKAAREQAAVREEQRERLAWAASELDKLAPLAGEWEELNAAHTRAAHAQDLAAAAQTALDAVAQSSDSALQQLRLASKALSAQSLIEPQFVELGQTLASATALIDEARLDLRHYLDRSDIDPANFERLDARLSAWMGTARRLRAAPAELAEAATKTRAQLDALDEAGNLELLLKREQETEAACLLEAKKLSKQRASASKKLQTAVTRALQSLGMQGARLEVGLEACALAAHGCDDIELRIATHEAASAKPIAKVASGGELSRIALALAVSTSAQQPVGTLLFDEVDAGVGGAVAETVGRLMKQLGTQRQVFAVTHLPQVAACADHHFVVAKTKDKTGWQSRVEPVRGEARVREIARMLGGEQLSAATQAHAQEMLASAEIAEPARDK
jgi:DNA repair protein RecN (Recombination protein N)